jgi:hypothetical protein
MSISLKLRIGIVATILMPFAISSAVDARLFRPRCTENDRGIGMVDATVFEKEVLLGWYGNTHYFQHIHVCYKKSWALVGKCNGGKNVYVNYGSPVHYGTVQIQEDLDNNSCYKFSVYGVDGNSEVLIGSEKIKT